MQRLYEPAFAPLKDGQLRFELANMIDQQNVLYAFVTCDSVRYMGKTTQVLQRRFLG